jgi:hypothetical protein
MYLGYYNLNKMLFYQVKLLLFALNALTIAKNLKIILEQQ